MEYENIMTDDKKRERRISVAFPDLVWDYLDNESKETGVPVSNLISLIVSNYVREKIKK